MGSRLWFTEYAAAPTYGNTDFSPNNGGPSLTGTNRLYLANSYPNTHPTLD
jgi:hypothetical protein